MARIDKEISIFTAIMVFAISTAGAIAWAQDGAIRSCQAKGPTHCKVEAIRAW